MEFLLREHSLDVEPDLVERVEELDAAVRAVVRRGVEAGVFAADLPERDALSSTACSTDSPSFSTTEAEPVRVPLTEPHAVVAAASTPTRDTSPDGFRFPCG
jgi:hypothetical protein